MKIKDDYDFSVYDVNLQEFTENVRHILNYGLYDLKYISTLTPQWVPAEGERPIVLSKIGGVGRLYIGDSNVESGWWYVNLSELPA
jgi:hypothetical protein